MLFSQPDVASFLSDSFECAWESVRPVPRLSIDFGDGRRLERTLRGNIATYLCTSDGDTFDLVPGLVSGPEYVERMREALTLHAAMRAGERLPAAAGPFEAARLVADWHRWLIDPEHVDLAAYPAEVRRAMYPAPLPGNHWGNPIELPLARAMRIPSLPLTVDGERSAPAPFPSKFRVEDPLERAVRDGSAGIARDDALLLDDRDAREHGYREARVLLRRQGMRRPADLTRDVYRELLHVDLDDPYLGLAPDVLGGEVGRH